MSNEIELYFAVAVEQCIVELIADIGEEVGIVADDSAPEVLDKLRAANKNIHRYVRNSGRDEFVALIEDDVITKMSYVYYDVMENAVKHFTLDREAIDLWRQNAQNDKNLEAPLH